jgi:hypothetical protein
MKLRKLVLAVICALSALAIQPSWAIRAVGAKVTGQITAMPSAVQIEVAHHVYTIKANSPAAKAYRHFSSGDTVDLMLDRPANRNETPTVVSILKHTD